MATRSRCRPSGRTFAAFAMLLVVAVLPPNIPAVRGAEPTVLPPLLDDGSPASTSRGHARGAVRAAGGARHILVQLHPHADEQRFLQQASAQGLRRLSRVYGTTWFRMAMRLRSR